MTAALGERMRELMKRHGINQSQLAARAGTTQPSISKYLSGEREPASGTLANIATALHTTSEYLLGLPESSIKTPYGTIKAYCARHGGDLSDEETRDLIMTLLAARGKEGDHGLQD
jgi:transcriptional regulator with XRE-family HTH domain